MKLLFAALMVLSVRVYAEDAKPKFEEHKAQVLKEIDERIAKLQEHKGCVTAAADKEAMMKCHESMKEFRHEQHAERKERREDWKEKREEMKKSKKAETK